VSTFRSLITGLTVLISAASLGACLSGVPVEEDLDIGFHRSAIEGGYLDDQDRAVVGVVHMSQGNFGSCTGTLIAPNVVLTAQHCVAPTSTGGGVNCSQTTFGQVYPASSMFVTTKTEFTYNINAYYAAQEIVLPPGEAGFCGRDQALIILSKPIPASEAEPMVPRVDEPIYEGEEYYAIGYGATFDGQGAESGTRQRRDDLFIKCVAGDCPQFAIKETEWRGDTGVCSGDSGGPALDLLDRVIGVASRGAKGCEMPIYGYVYGWGQWIMDVTVYAASLSGTEPPPWATGWPTDPHYSQPVGAECSDSSQCPSSACLNGYCTRLCDRAPCPEGFLCGDGGFCEKEPEPEPAAIPKDDAGIQEVSSCSLSRPPQSRGADPAQPPPWIFSAACLGLALLTRRRRRQTV
jgi:MYXO-CTERM domain-containing protein